MADLWWRTTQMVRKETCYHLMGYSIWLAARVLLYAPFQRQDNTYQGLCNTSRVELAGTRTSSMGPPWGINPTTHRATSRCSIAELHLAPSEPNEHSYRWIKAWYKRCAWHVLQPAQPSATPRETSFSSPTMDIGCSFKDLCKHLLQVAIKLRFIFESWR